MGRGAGDALRGHLLARRAAAVCQGHFAARPLEGVGGARPRCRRHRGVCRAAWRCGDTCTAVAALVWLSRGVQRYGCPEVHAGFVLLGEEGNSSPCVRLHMRLHTVAHSNEHSWQQGTCMAARKCMAAIPGYPCMAATPEYPCMVATPGYPSMAATMPALVHNPQLLLQHASPATGVTRWLLAPRMWMLVVADIRPRAAPPRDCRVHDLSAGQGRGAVASMHRVNRRSTLTAGLL
eukprot:365353-Chlamydomonas_euryale.AAC.5